MSKISCFRLVLKLLKTILGKIIFSVCLNKKSCPSKPPLHCLFEPRGEIEFFSGQSFLWAGGAFLSKFRYYLNELLADFFSSLNMLFALPHFFINASMPPITAKIKPMSQPLPTRMLRKAKTNTITPPAVSIPL